MRVGIIGCGKVGKALGTWLAALGHPALFTSRHPESAREAAQAEAKESRAVDLRSAVTESDVTLLTLPFEAIVPTLDSVRAALQGKIIVDVSNPITADHRDLAVGHSDSGAERIARAFPEVHVVKAFNAVFAEVYQARTAELGGRRISIFFAGDDVEAKRRVNVLIQALGFDPVDAGPLRNARYLEPLSLLNIHLGRVLGLGTSIGLSLLRP